MSRAQTFVSALLLIVLLAAWFMEESTIREGWARVDAATKAAEAAKGRPA